MSEQNLLAQLQRLSDLEDIRDLRHRYAYLANVVDGVPGDQKAFAELFTESGTLDVGMGLATGREAIEAMLRALAVDWVCAMHYMLNPLIELQGERATGTVSGLFAFTTRSEPRPVWLSNLYRDEYVRTDEGWRFQSVRVRTTFADPAVFMAYAAFAPVAPGVAENVASHR